MTRFNCVPLLIAGVFVVVGSQTPALAQFLSIGPGGVQVGGFGAGYYNGYGYGAYAPAYRPFGPGAATYTGYGNGSYGYGNAYPYYTGYRPIGWRLRSWGLGGVGYSNPYYTNTGGTFGDYNYSQPIPVSSRDPVSTSANPACADSLGVATAAFKQGDYDTGLDTINKGLIQCPSDSVLHEFRALVLFAKSDYQQAASTLHSVLAVGPGWNWNTLSSLYPEISVYTAQLRSLEAFTKEHPQDGASQFLLAYHYMADGYPDAAAAALQKVVKLVPGDRVASDMLRMISKPPADQPTDSGHPSTTPLFTAQTLATTAAAKPIDGAKLAGTWRASRNDGSKYELTLKNDASFSWKYTLKETVQQFGGTYKIDVNVVTLERKGGGPLIAAVIFDGDQKFNFKLMGGPQEDPGLNFSK